MPKPVKLSDNLISSARRIAQAADRSIAGQIEHWANLGRAAEATLSTSEIHALKLTQGELRQAFPSARQRRAVRNALAKALSEPAQRAFAARLPKLTAARYGTDPAYPGAIVRIDPDGTRTPGRFVRREFRAASEGALRSTAMKGTKTGPAPRLARAR
jgi:hypothetical protein